jgi:hypothetical protein
MIFPWLVCWARAAHCVSGGSNRAETRGRFSSLGRRAGFGEIPRGLPP